MRGFRKRKNVVARKKKRSVAPRLMRPWPASVKLLPSARWKKMRAALLKKQPSARPSRKRVVRPRTKALQRRLQRGRRCGRRRLPALVRVLRRVLPVLPPRARRVRVRRPLVVLHARKRLRAGLVLRPCRALRRVVRHRTMMMAVVAPPVAKVEFRRSRLPRRARVPMTAVAAS